MQMPAAHATSFPPPCLPLCLPACVMQRASSATPPRWRSRSWSCWTTWATSGGCRQPACLSWALTCRQACWAPAASSRDAPLHCTPHRTPAAAIHNARHMRSPLPWPPRLSLPLFPAGIPPCPPSPSPAHCSASTATASLTSPCSDCEQCELTDSGRTQCQPARLTACLPGRRQLPPLTHASIHPRNCTHPDALLSATHSGLRMNVTPPCTAAQNASAHPRPAAVPPPSPPSKLPGWAATDEPPPPFLPVSGVYYTCS